MSKATPYVPSDGFSKDAIIVTSYHTTIAAPASQAFKLVTNPSTWPKWNTFCPSSSVETVETDTRMTMQVRMDPKYPSSLSPLKVHVESVEETPEGYRVHWGIDGPWPAFLLHAERTQEFVKVDDETCEYRTTELMGGLMAYVVKYLYPTQGTLQARFMDWCNDLREYSESTWKNRATDRS